MAYQLRKHNMNKDDVSRLKKLIAGDYMPSTMSVVAFSALPNVDGCLHLKTFSCALIRLLVD